ncbi:MAG: NPCBM/NEW2 domain-containing protein [Bacteroidota bacterium]
MKIKILAFSFVSLLFISFTISLSPYGIEHPGPIGPYLDGAFPTTSPFSSSWKAVPAFPDVTFTDPIAMEEIPSSNYYYVAGKEGFIWLIEDDENTTEKTVVLDIRDRIITSGDGGLINFVLHPEFSVDGSENQGYIYIFYAYHPLKEHGEDPRMNRISRFRTFEDSYMIDPDSEYILVQDYDPQGFHMGGAMFFDHEGYFYFSMGDGGEYNDLFGSSQQIDQRLWGGLFRIDVDNDPSRSHPIRRQPIAYEGQPEELPETFTQGYMIPNDNPWLAEDGSILEEFYALGLRSPHRATLDPAGDRVWVADVGQQKREEITVLTKGSNGEWPYKEGNVTGPKDRPDQVIGEEITPIYEYGRTVGNAIIGGFVYEGDRWNSYLNGMYIFGDHGTRNVWALNPVTQKVNLMATIPDFGRGNKSGISSFATNSRGDIFVLKLFGTNMDGGFVYKLELDEKDQVDLPMTLSETGAFTDLETLTPREGVIPYTVNSPLWSDNADKNRWVSVPNDGTHDTPEEQVFFSEDDEWQFPNGSVFIKHFELSPSPDNPGKNQKVETRFFIIDENGEGYGMTYAWNDEGTDAVLLSEGGEKFFEIIDEGGQSKDFRWDYPSSLQCLNCHTPNSGFVLGLKTWQLNSDLEYPSSGITINQLATWNHLGIFANDFEESAIDTFPQAMSLTDQGSLQKRVTSYWDANCSHCHRPNGVEGAFDARYSTPMAYKNIVNAATISRNSPSDGIVVDPGHPDLSEMWLRTNSQDENQMPPIFRNTIDGTFIDVLTEWIEGLDKDCSGNYISDFAWAADPVNGFGPVEIDMSNGNDVPLDGRTLSIAGTTFDKGLGVHATSELLYAINGKYAQFKAQIGVDDESCELASVQFEVYVDEALAFRSPIMQKGEGPRFVSIDLEGAEMLKLVVTSPNDGPECDHADWAEAKLLRYPDEDNDGVCDENDLCPGGDDRIDENGNGLPDYCERAIDQYKIAVQVRPNPFRNHLEIILEKPDPLIQKARLFVYDLNGRLMQQDFNVNYDVPHRMGANWQPGAYIVYVKAGRFSNRVKVIKQQ